MARTKDPRLEAARRELVLEAVFDLLADASWRSVTLDAVARRAGVSKGVVTYWFDSKEALLVAAMERFLSGYAERLTAAARAGSSARERLRALIAIALPSQAEVAREVRFQAEIWSFAKENADARARVVAAQRGFRQACEALIAIGVAEGYITTPHAAGLYAFVHALVDGLSLHMAFGEAVDVEATREALLLRLEQWFTAP